MFASAFRNVDLVSKCGGISTLLWNILDCHQFVRLNESLTCTVMYIMNHPRSRHYIKANTDLEVQLCVAAIILTTWEVAAFMAGSKRVAHAKIHPFV